MCGISSGDAAHYPEPSLTFATEGENNMNALDDKTTQVVWEILNAALYDLTQGKKDDGINAIEEAIKLIEGESK